MKNQIGRHLSFVECRESRGLGVGGGLAQRATISESGRDVVAVAMRWHLIPPPVVGWGLLASGRNLNRNGSNITDVLFIN